MILPYSRRSKKKQGGGGEKDLDSEMSGGKEKGVPMKRRSPTKFINSKKG